MEQPTADDDLVDLKWIANTAVVGASTVSNWRKRDRSFPSRAGGTEGRPLFSKQAVLEWGSRTGRFSSGPALGIVPSRERARALIAEMRAFVPPRLFLEAAVRIFSTLAELEMPDWTRPRIPRTDRHPTQIGSFAFDDLDPDIVAKMTSSIRPMVGSHEIGAVFEEVIDQLSDKEITQPSSSALADAMLALVHHRSGTVLDPAAGIGTLLVRARESLDARRLIAWEIDDEALSVLWLRFQLRGWSIHLEHRDSTGPDNDPSTDEADILLLDPPFEVLSPRQRMEPASKIAARKGSVTKEWIDMAISHLAPEGVAIVHLPASTANDRSGMSERTDLITSGAVRAVVSLPPGMVPGAHATFATDLWVLGREQVAPTANIRMVDASRVSTNEIGLALRGVLDGTASQRERVRAVDVNRFELLRNDAVITPGRWTEARYTERDAASGLRSAVDSLRTFDQDVSLLSRIDLAVELAGTGAMAESLRTLRESGHVMRVVGRPSAVKRETALLVEARVLSGKALHDPTAATVELVDPRSLLEPGDVVQSEIGRPVVKVWTEDGWAVGPAMTAWRITSDLLVPKYLRLVLTSSIAAAIGSRGGRALHFDPQLMPIPLLSLADQHAIVAQVGRIDQAIDAMTGARDNLVRARDALTDAAAAGWLRQSTNDSTRGTGLAETDGP